MNLPNAQLARVQQTKVLAYLLNAAHPDNGGKSGFFGALGFSRADWRTLALALRRLAAAGDVTDVLAVRYGTKYVVDGQIDTPSGASAKVRTVWIVESGRNEPRLVTAYPQEK